MDQIVFSSSSLKLLKRNSGFSFLGSYVLSHFLRMWKSNAHSLEEKDKRKCFSNGERFFGMVHNACQENWELTLIYLKLLRVNFSPQSNSLCELPTRSSFLLWPMSRNVRCSTHRAGWMGETLLAEPSAPVTQTTRFAAGRIPSSFWPWPVLHAIAGWCV